MPSPTKWTSILLVACLTQFAGACELSFWPILLRPTELSQTYSKSGHEVANLPDSPTVQIGEILRFLVNCTCCHRPQEVARNAALKHYGGQSGGRHPVGGLYYRFISENRYSVLLSRWPTIDPVIRSRFDTAGDMSARHAECRRLPQCAVLYTPVLGGSTGGYLETVQFWVEANTLGRSAIRVDLVWMNSTLLQQPSDIPIPSPLDERDLKIKKASTKPAGGGGEGSNLESKHGRFDMVVIARGVIPGRCNVTTSKVTVFLKPQIFYTAFDWTVFFIACTIALSTGCRTDPVAFRKQFKKPMALGVGILTQLIVAPLFGLTAAYASSLGAARAFGLFVTTTIQAGGGALIITSLSDCHEQYAMALAHVSALLNLVTAPLWVYIISTYVYSQSIYLLRFCGLLAVVVMAQFTGLILRYSKPSVAGAILTWFTRPFLLLAAILFITLGVYINQYAFQASQPMAYLRHVGLSLLGMVTLSYACGWLTGVLIRLSTKRCRALANQNSVYQGLMAIPMLRICVPSPEGELASTIAMWTVFLMPVPLVYNVILKMLAETVKSAYQEHRRRMQKRGPTALLCTESLAAVAVTSFMLPGLATTDNNNLNNNICDQNNSNVYDDISSIRTTNSDSRLHQNPQSVRSKSAATFFNKNSSTTDFEARQRLIESLAGANAFTVTGATGGIGGLLSPTAGLPKEAMSKKNGPPRTPSHLPRTAKEEHYFGVGAPPRGLSSTSKPIF